MLEIIRRANQFADATAICQGDESSSYLELVARSSRIASALLQDNTDLCERRVAMLCPSALEFASCQWAIWQAGGICVPLSSSATASELEYAISDSQADTVIAVRTAAEKLRPICNSLGLRFVIEDEAVKHAECQFPSVGKDRPAMILYTSGTTNKPKGVLTTHANIEAQVQSLVEAWEWSSSDRIPLFLPLHHIHGIVNVVSCALWSGAALRSFDVFHAATILNRVSCHEFTLFMAVPTIYFKLIQAIEEASSELQERWCAGFAQMRLMVSGSAALPASVHIKWHSLTGQSLLERYGMTEIGMALSNPLRGERRPGAVGVPLPQVEVRLKSEAGEIIEQEGEPGEIQVRGPTVFREYWNRPEATLAAFDGDWFRTGDMAVKEDHYFRIMGRLSVDIIKSGGYKLSALEIEDVLLQHPQVQQCAVVGVPDETWGECVAAAIVFHAGHELDQEQIRLWCRDRISPYKIPKLMLAVPELPRNAMGKIIKPQVARLWPPSVQ